MGANAVVYCFPFYGLQIGSGTMIKTPLHYLCGFVGLQYVCTQFKIHLMKKVLLTAFSLITLAGGAQDLTLPQKIGIPLKDGAIVYELVDTVKASQAKIYTAIKATTTELFSSSGGYMISASPSEATVLGKGNIPITYKLPLTTIKARAMFNYTLQAKEGRYRILLTAWEGTMAEYAQKGTPVLEAYTTGLSASQKYRERYLTSFHETVQAALLTFSANIKKQLTTLEW